MGRKKRAPLEPRTIYVYVPTIDMAETWKKAAKKADVSISTFVQEIVEKHLVVEGTITARQSLEKQLKKMEEHNSDLREENKELSTKIERHENLLDRYERQMKELKNKQFLSNNVTDGITKYEKNLVELFVKEGPIKEEKILDKLHIKHDDIETIKAISRQIENLLDLGAIKRYRGEYQWQK